MERFLPTTPPIIPTLRILPIVRTIQAGISVPTDEVVVRFDCATQSIGALREAAYHMIPKASCVIELVPGAYVCRLLAKEIKPTQPLDDQALRQHFLDLVTDENLREKVGAETSAIRDVILALAFGALASSSSTS